MSRIILHEHCLCSRASASPLQAPVSLARPVQRTRRPACRSVQARSTRLRRTPCFTLAHFALWRRGVQTRHPRLRRSSGSRSAPSKHRGGGSSKRWCCSTPASPCLTVRSSRTRFTAANFSGMFVLYCRRAAGRLNSGVSRHENVWCTSCLVRDLGRCAGRRQV